MSFPAMLVGFSLVSIGFAVGFFVLSRLIGQAVGASTLRTQRTIQQIYESGRAPERWIARADTDEDRRKALQKELRRIESEVRASPAFAEEGVREEILEAVSAFKQRIATDPISELIGPDPALRSTVLVVSPEVEAATRRDPRARSSIRTVERDGYRVFRLSGYDGDPFQSLVSDLNGEHYRPVDTLLVARAGESLIPQANQAGFATVCFSDPGDTVSSLEDADRIATDMAQVVAYVREMESIELD